MKINAKNQYNSRIENIELNLLKNNKLILKNLTGKNEDANMRISFRLFNTYRLKAYYKGFMIYDKEIPKFSDNIDINLDLYDLSIDIKDHLDFNPGVNVRPILTSNQMYNQIDIIPKELGSGKYLFKNLPASLYKLYISYGRFSNVLEINLPDDGDSASIKFTATFDLNTIVFDSRGSPVNDEKLKINIKRDGINIHKSISSNTEVELPPGRYTVSVNSDGYIIGSNTIDLTSDKTINIITTIEPILPVLITGIIIILILELLVLLLIKRISFNTFLKLLAMAIVILSLFQPWWTLYGTSDKYQAEKRSEMLINPQTMVETITYEDKDYRELATLPEMFTDFLGTLLLIIYTGIILLLASFIPNILLKRRFFIILITASIVFLILVIFAFSIGMSLISELTLGDLNGTGPIDVSLQNGVTINMQASWGLGFGFYLCVLSAIILIVAGVFDYLQNKEWFNRFKKKNIE
ncbi:MAG: PEGA domain-containing protein [Asgard group archaeon]|nr:PEGA domain-containing protein [Asgard group archaeon]